MMRLRGIAGLVLAASLVLAGHSTAFAVPPGPPNGEQTFPHSSGPLVRMSPAHVGFGIQPVGSTTTRVVTVVNKTNEPVVIAGVAMTSNSGGFTTSFAGTCTGEHFGFDAPLGPGESCSVELTFAPVTSGSFRATFCVSAVAGKFPKPTAGHGSYCVMLAGRAA
jgi:ASPM-SPD-2-Hydin domain-containing protein